MRTNININLQLIYGQLIFPRYLCWSTFSVESPGQLVTGSRERIITSLLSAGSLPPVPPEGRMPRLSLACRGHTDGSDIWWLLRKTFKLLGPSIGQIFPGRSSTGYSSGSSWSGFLRVLRFPPPGKLISSSSSFHRLDMTLAVAEVINPDKPNQTEDFHKTPRLEDTPCTLKLYFKVESEPPVKVLWQCWLVLSIPRIESSFISG